MIALAKTGRNFTKAVQTLAAHHGVSFVYSDTRIYTISLESESGITQGCCSDPEKP